MATAAPAFAPLAREEHEALIEVSGLERTFMVGDEPLTVLRGIDFTIPRGAYVAIIGPSGSGKSTLMYQLGCLDTPSAGTVRLAGYDVGSLDDAELAALRNRFIGFVFQAFNLLPRTTAVDNVALPLRYAGVGLRERRRRAREALGRVALSHREDHTPERLSGGERQRVAIARAIVTEPALLLCDEPTGNLDQKVGREIVELFERLNDELGVTVIIVTHDPSLARRVRRVIKLVDGRLVHDGPPTADL
ncbi:MAG: ABC transporter ATP-binding protein [Myxococcales bacterium]|nr:ABC transporter ATP-binding protein [Myxococcales bacterium]